MEDFEEIDLHMVPVGEIFRFAAQGWVLRSSMGETKHGDWSVLMEREVAPGQGDAGNTAANDPAGALVGRPFYIGKRRAAPD